MVQCFVPGCSHRSNIQDCEMFRFPSIPSKRQAWINHIRRADSKPTEFSRVCSCHFVNSDKKNTPSLFEWTKGKRFLFTSPEKRKRKSRCHSLLEVQSVGNDCKDTSPTVEELQLLIAQLGSEVNRLQTANEILTRNASATHSIMSTLQEDAAKRPFSFKDIEDNAEKVSHYIGLPNASTFCLLLSLFLEQPIKYYNGWAVQSLSMEDQLFLTLWKLRRNLSHTDIAERFKISRGTVTNIFLTWLYALHQVAFQELFSKIPSRHKNRTALPDCFKDFPNCRIVVDCTEVTTAAPTEMDRQNKMYSNYKKRMTLKGLVAVAPNGTVTFLSKLYPGSTSDKVIFGNCGIINHLKPGDSVLADIGFLISDLLPEGVELNIPPFKSTEQFTPEQVTRNISIARARIHVERVNERIKNFLILHYIPQYYVPYASMIYQVCGALTTFKRAIIAN